MLNRLLGRVEHEEQKSEEKKELTASEAIKKKHLDKQQDIAKMIADANATMEQYKKNAKPKAAPVVAPVIISQEAAAAKVAEKEAAKAKLEAEKVASKLEDKKRRDAILLQHKQRKADNKALLEDKKLKDKHKFKNRHEVALNEQGERIPVRGYQPTDLQRHIASLENRVPTKKHEVLLNEYGDRIPNSYLTRDAKVEREEELPARFDNTYVEPRMVKETYSGLALMWVNKEVEARKNTRLTAEKAYADAKAAACLAAEADAKVRELDSSSSSSSYGKRRW